MSIIRRKRRRKRGSNDTWNGNYKHKESSWERRGERSWKLWWITCREEDDDEKSLSFRFILSAAFPLNLLSTTTFSVVCVVVVVKMYINSLAKVERTKESVFPGHNDTEMYVSLFKALGQEVVNLISLLVFLLFFTNCKETVKVRRGDRENEIRWWRS